MLTKPDAVQATKRAVVIPAPRMFTALFRLIGTAPYMQSHFSHKAKDKMMATQKAGSQARAKKTREARDFESDFEAATHKSEEGWAGIPAGAFRTAMISACRLVSFKMTVAKLAVFVEGDGLDSLSGQPLVRIHGHREMTVLPARNDNGGCDLRSRPMWRNWHVDLRVTFDEDQFSLEDISNLLARAGQQVGLGEGRPDSRDSTGCGFGTFRIESRNE